MSSSPMSASASSSARPIGSFQLMQAKVADMYVALNSARAYVYQVAKACDAGKTTRFDAAGAILLASENAVKVANEAVQALGGAGYTKDWPVERYYRDAKLLDIGAGTNEIRRMLIGREIDRGMSVVTVALAILQGLSGDDAGRSVDLLRAIVAASHPRAYRSGSNGTHPASHRRRCRPDARWRGAERRRSVSAPGAKAMVVPDHASTTRDAIGHMADAGP